MQRLRNASFLARLVLAWFALAIGVAVASPLVKPVDMELVCSGVGAMKLLVKAGGTDADTTTSHTLDCPLCASLGAPPPANPVASAFSAPLSHAVRSIPAARIAGITAAPLPARGPPALLVL